MEDARANARQIRSQALMGVDLNLEQEKLKVMPLVTQFFEEQYLPFVKGYKRSWYFDEKMFDNKIGPVWGDRKMSEITRQDIEQFNTNFINAGLKPATTNRYLALVKYIFSLAEKWEVIDKSPARDISKLEENNIIERYLTAQETENLLRELKCCEHTVVPDLIEFLILTGARKSEATEAQSMGGLTPLSVCY